MSGETEQSDFAGLVAMATVAVLDGCPWVEKGHLWELSSAVAALVVERVGEVDSLSLPNGTLLRKGATMITGREAHCHQPDCRVHLADWHDERAADAFNARHGLT